jgi:hypothetical protein
LKGGNAKGGVMNIVEKLFLLIAWRGMLTGCNGTKATTIENKITNHTEIEHLLDGLLDFCFDEAILVFYRKLCPYYFDLNPIATIDYIDLYRQTWDEGGKMNFKKDRS